MNIHDVKEVSENIRAELKIVQSLLSSEDFLNTKVESINSSDEKIISWSKVNAFSIIPFYNELTGFKSGEMLYKEPRSKKNIYCYSSKKEDIDKIISYNSKGEVEDVSFIIRDEAQFIEIRKNHRGEFVSLAQTFLDGEKKPVKSFFVNDDDNAVGYYYFYAGNKIEEILSVDINSPLPYVLLSCLYDEEGEIKEIYFYNKKGKVTVYPR